MGFGWSINDILVEQQHLREIAAKAASFCAS